MSMNTVSVYNDPRLEPAIQKIERTIPAPDNDAGLQPVKSREGLQPTQKTTDVTYLTGAQDFQGGGAFVAVPHRRLDGTTLKSERYLITSDRRKIPLDNKVLLESGLYVEREPFLIERWSWVDIDDFLRGGEAMSLGSIYQMVVDELQKYFDFGDIRWVTFIALWCIGTYFHRLFTAYPYIHLNGDTGSGKTKCLSFIAAIAFNGEQSVNNTPAYLTRVIHNNHATCCIDEVEKFNKAQDEDSKTIFAMLNAGYKRGTFVGKCEQPRNSKNWEPKRFEAYAPKVLAGIQSLYPTLSARCIPIIMVKSGKATVVNREMNEQDQIWQSIRNSLYRTLLVHHETIHQQYKNITDLELLGRSWELWRSILAVAKAVGEPMYYEMRALALKVEAERRDIESDSVATPKLLRGLLTLLEKDGALDDRFYPTEVINSHLCEYDKEDYGWLTSADTKAKPGRWLGKQLRLAGVVTGKAQQKKVEGQNTKGYVIRKAVLIERLKSFGLMSEPPSVDVAPSTEANTIEDALP